jgi:CHAT domain-containing protein
LGEGIGLLKKRRPGLARPFFEAALAELTVGHSPFANWAALNLSICEYQNGNPGRATVRLGKIVPYLDPNRTPALAGRVLWQLGLSEGVRGELASAVMRLGLAADAFRRNQDSESFAAVENLLASTYDGLGDRARSWRHRYLALLNLAHGSIGRRWVVVKGTAESLTERDQPDLALPFLDELVRLSGEDPELKAQALLRRSAALARLRRPDLAELDHSAALTAVGHITDSALRTRIGVDILVSRAEILARYKPEEAINLLTEASGFYGQAENEFLLARVLLARARAALVIGHEEEAERDLNDALSRAERRFSRIEATDLKLSFLGELQTTFDELILAQYQKEPEAAFATTERSRSQLLLARAGARTLTASEVRAALPSGVTLIEYALVRGHLFVWVLARGRVVSTEVEWVSAGGPHLLQELADKIDTDFDEPGLRRLLIQLRNLLIQPIASRLPPDSLLVFVPSDTLGSVPFSALLDGSRNRFIIQDNPLILAPSASIYIAGLRRHLKRGKAPVGSLLAVADPEFNRIWHSGLSSLPGAREEVAGIAKLYPSAVRVLEGRQATPEALAAAIQGREVLHFAVHAITNLRQPDRSGLVLAPPGREPGAGDLLTADIERLPLSDVRLVVLANCGSANGKGAAGEGTMSLARSFLGAGAPAVVASLWQINDKFASNFFLRFYGRLQNSGDAVTALRETQLSFLKSAHENYRSPIFWGGLQIYGAMAKGWKKTTPSVSLDRPRTADGGR